MGLSPKKSACVGCPIHAKCDWIAQSAENGPGLKIIVSAYLGVAIPGLAHAAGEEEGGAPILGFVIDEAYEQSLMHKAVLLTSDLPVAVFYNSAAFRLSRSDKQLLDDGVKLLRRALDKNGFLQLSEFEPITRHATIEDGEWVLQDRHHLLSARKDH